MCCFFSVSIHKTVNRIVHVLQFMCLYCPLAHPSQKPHEICLRVSEKTSLELLGGLCQAWLRLCCPLLVLCFNKYYSIKLVIKTSHVQLAAIPFCVAASDKSVTHVSLHVSFIRHVSLQMYLSIFHIFFLFASRCLGWASDDPDSQKHPCEEESHCS